MIRSIFPATISPVLDESQIRIRYGSCSGHMCIMPLGSDYRTRIETCDLLWFSGVDPSSSTTLEKKPGTTPGLRSIATTGFAV